MNLADLAYTAICLAILAIAWFGWENITGWTRPKSRQHRNRPHDAPRRERLF
jgi:hypothetical protein